MAMTDGTISIDVVLNEKEFKESLENMGGTVNAGADLMIKSVGGLSGSFALLPDTITSVMKAVPGIIDSVIKNISGQKPAMAKTGTDFFTSLISDLSGVTSAVTVATAGISDAAIKKFADFIPDMRNAGIDFFTSLTGRLPGIIKEITGAVPDIVEAVTERIEKGEPAVSSAGFVLFTSLTGRLPRAIREIVKAPGEIVSALVEQFDGFTERFETVGENIVRGVWDGISSMGTWLSDKATGFFNGIVGSVTKFLGISSPSKLFSDLVGKNIALGVGAGIDGEMRGVIDRTRAQMARLAGAAAQSAGFDFTGAGVIGQYGRGEYNLSADERSSALQQNAGSPAIPEINIVLEPSGDLRGFFDYIRMGVKRSAYLNGGE